jgi:hypothetical protein
MALRYMNMPLVSKAEQTIPLSAAASTISLDARDRKLAAFDNSRQIDGRFPISA